MNDESKIRIPEALDRAGITGYGILQRASVDLGVEVVEPSTSIGVTSAARAVERGKLTQVVSIEVARLDQHSLGAEIGQIPSQVLCLWLLLKGKKRIVARERNEFEQGPYLTPDRSLSSEMCPEKALARGFTASTAARTCFADTELSTRAVATAEVVPAAAVLVHSEAPPAFLFSGLFGIDIPSSY